MRLKHVCEVGKESFGAEVFTMENLGFIDRKPFGGTEEDPVINCNNFFLSKVVNDSMAVQNHLTSLELSVKPEISAFCFISSISTSLLQQQITVNSNGLKTLTISSGTIVRNPEENNQFIDTFTGLSFIIFRTFFGRE
mmetsp:Transcript_105811/g.158378  ORF Transcript_105811/g.158378 Transcript_105811/m.158378 type:complete len:138 (+) Transcript_105811:501-914(+)